jgi:hypothetical protein
MQKSEAVFVAIRVMALWMLATGLAYLPSQVFFLSDVVWLGGDTMVRTSTWAGLAYQAMLLFIGGLLWVYADGICRRILGEEKNGQILIIAADPDKLQIVAFTILGIFLALPAFASLAQTATVLLYMHYNHAVEPWVQHDRGGFDPRFMHGPIVDFCVRFLFGVWLIIRPRNFVRILERLREKLDVRA